MLSKKNTKTSLLAGEAVCIGSMSDGHITDSGHVTLYAPVAFTSKVYSYPGTPFTNVKFALSDNVITCRNPFVQSIVYDIILI